MRAKLSNIKWDAPEDVIRVKQLPVELPISFTMIRRAEKHAIEFAIIDAIKEQFGYDIAACDYELDVPLSKQ